MANIHDVARSAGVSTATVTRVLKRPDLVAEATLRRVQNAIDVLRYTPNSAAVSLRTARTKKILVTVPDISNPFFGSVIRGVEEEAQNAGYAVLLGDTRNEASREELYASMLGSEADGLIFLGHRLPEAANLLLARQGVRAPIVNACEFSPSLRVSGVHIDNVAAAKTAMDALYEVGHRDIAVISGPLEGPLSRDRLQGVRQAAEEYGEIARLQVCLGDFSLESGRIEATRILAESKPTAIFCFSDDMAIGAMAAIHSAGLRCPEDVSVMGFDDIEVARYLNPPLTTIRQPMALLGQQAVQLLLSILSGQQTEPMSVTLTHTLVVRRSVSAARGR